MVKIERTLTPPASLAKERQKPHGNYACEDVVRQLHKDFHGKCYICELGHLTDCQVEHLLPHHNRKWIDRVFDWDNLFYVCPHCNSIKNASKYEEKILDCCKDDPELFLDHSLQGGHVVISAHIPGETNETVLMTADLIQNCFEMGNHGIRKIGSQERFRRLSETMGILHHTLGQFKRNKTSKIRIQALRRMLSREYEFSAFTRHYVRTHLDDYPELESFLT